MVSLWALLAMAFAAFDCALRNRAAGEMRARVERRHAIGFFPRASVSGAGSAATMLSMGIFHQGHENARHWHTNRSNVVELGRIELVHVISVGRSQPEQFITEELLDAPGFTVGWVSTHEGVPGAAEKGTPHIVVVHESPDSFDLANTCRRVRQACPQARILVIGGGAAELEDTLYDDRLGPASSGQELRAKILEMARWLDLWRFEDGRG